MGRRSCYPWLFYRAMVAYKTMALIIERREVKDGDRDEKECY
jgi:hypothetical protein